MSRSRILILTTSYLPMLGGSELAIRNIAERLPEWDFDLVTGRYAPDLPAVEQMNRVRVHRVGGVWLKIPFLLPKNFLPIPLAFKAWLLTIRHRYALVHAYQASQAGGAAWLLKFLRPGLPLLVTVQEGRDLDRQPRLVRFFRSLIFHRADRITAISSMLAAYARRYAQDTPIDLIPNGVDIREARHAPRNPDPTILTVSRLVPKNNVEGVIRAFAVIRGSVPNARLLIIGDGPLRSELQALSHELSIREAVDFRGTVSHGDLPSIYAVADVFVRPSVSEGLGSAFLEAMAARVPVVGSRVGGIPDIIHDGETGLFCDPFDPADIAEKISRLFEDRDLRDRMVGSAYRMVAEGYTWDSVTDKMRGVYRQLLL